jgi:hypothetical protein
VSGVYRLLNAFGTPTATKLFIMQGSEAPAAPRSFKWRLTEAAGTTYQAPNRDRGRPAGWYKASVAGG